MTLSKNKSVCIIVPVHNRVNLTLKFIESFVNSEYSNYKIVVIDDGSTDDTFSIIHDKYPQIHLIKGDGNLWWTGATNEGVKYAIANDYDYVLTINNDTIVDKRYLLELIKFSDKHPDSLIGSLILFAGTNKIWSAGGFIKWSQFNPFNLFFHGQDLDPILREINFDKFHPEILNGNGTLIPSHIFKKVGLYNFAWTPQYHADSEIVLRARRQGFETYICPNALIENDTDEHGINWNLKKLIFFKKSDLYWKPIIYIYYKYAPFIYKLFFLRQYLPFILDRLNLQSFKNIIKRFNKSKT